LCQNDDPQKREDGKSLFEEVLKRLPPFPKFRLGASFRSIESLEKIEFLESEIIDAISQTEEYSKVFYDGEIAKLYDAVGWDKSLQKYTGKTKPVKWVRIHNLPDHVYFNHSQHVKVGKIECTECHGEIAKMDTVYQNSPLTMGWCIDCHRKTEVKMEGNAYYNELHAKLKEK
jgi:hypothetical protein